MKLLRTSAAVVAFLVSALLAGCSGESGGEGEHVWKEQTDTMDRARQTEEIMKKKAEEQRKAIDNIDQ